jgi:surfeit locus 1 family protein
VSSQPSDAHHTSLASTRGVAPGLKRHVGLVLLGLLTIAAVIFLVSLGNWQLRRLAYKTALAATVTERLKTPPVRLPATAAWSTMDAEAVDYTPVVVTGHYRPQEFHVFATLTDPKGRDGGVGWWVFTPFVEPDGTEVIVNRGFVPDRLKNASSRPDGNLSGEIRVTGLLRRPEGSNVFTPANDIAGNRWFTRDPIAMAKSLGLPPDKTLPYYIDASAAMTPPGGYPQAGETVVDFSNNHLGYAFTWYGLAIAAAGVYGAYAWRRISSSA